MALTNEVLALLEKRRGESVSGQQMAQLLGVSRNAVWKAVALLRQAGYGIRSASNRGYALEALDDRLSAEGIRARLKPPYQGLEISVFEELDSTNAEAKRRIARGLEKPLLVAAGRQSAGRGRLGRSFYSPAETGAYMTLAFPVGTAIADAVSLTSAAAVAVVRAVEKTTPAKPMIKWVNDVYVGGRKICGILTEGVACMETGAVEHMLIGIGVNLSTADFPEELRGVAGSLNAPGLTRNGLIAAIAAELLPFIENPAGRDFLPDYIAHSLALGKRVTYSKDGVSADAVAVGVDENGGLIVRGDDGRQTVLKTGEISLRIQG